MLCMYNIYKSAAMLNNEGGFQTLLKQSVEELDQTGLNLLDQEINNYHISKEQPDIFKQV